MKLGLKRPWQRGKPTRAPPSRSGSERVGRSVTGSYRRARYCQLERDCALEGQSRDSQTPYFLPKSAAVGVDYAARFSSTARIGGPVR